MRLLVCMLLCQVIGTFGYKLFTVPGPKIRPTKGYIWPRPQQEINGTSYYVYRSLKFHVTVSNHKCELLTSALKRYNLIFRELELFQSFNYIGRDALKAKEKKSHGVLHQLKIDLSAECEDWPHYDMDESYSLKVAQISELKSKSIWGILRGLESFVQLFYFPDDYSEIRINATKIMDYPAYKHRGLLIDTGRHYLSLSTIFKTIDALAMNKMNVLHWHLVDDQSFPYQSEQFPSLSEKGAYYATMVYTQADIRSVVAYARERGVRVIPEIDVPGHTRSWGEAFPNILTDCYVDNKVAGLGPLDPTIKETYELLEPLFEEVYALFPDEYLHIGGDEVQTDCWKSNPRIREFLKRNNLTVRNLQAFFMNKTLPLLPANTKPILWQEAFDMNALPKQKTHVQVWNFEWIQEMIKVLKAGHYVIFSASWYLDYHNPTWEEFYRADPRTMVYRVRRKTDGLEDIVGGEACMWGEMADDTNILTKTWPRTSAVAELLWTGLDYMAPATSDPVTEIVQRRMEEHACRMNRRGVPTQPPNGPGFCVGAPTPLEKTYYVVNK